MNDTIKEAMDRAVSDIHGRSGALADVRRRVAQRRRRQKLTVILTAGTLSLASLAFVWLAFASTGGSRQVAASPTFVDHGASGSPSPAPGRGVQFTPPIEETEADSTIHLVFPDGTPLDLTVPSGIVSLDSVSFSASTVGDLDTSEIGNGCCGRPIELYYGEPSSLPQLGPKTVDVFEGQSGDVLLVEGDAQNGAQLYLVYRFGPWTALVYDVRDGMSDDERAAWASGLDGHVDPDGFLILQASGRLQLGTAGFPTTDGPAGLIMNANGTLDLSMKPIDCQPEDPDMIDIHDTSNGLAFATWCPRGGLMLITATAPRSDVSLLVNGLKVSDSSAPDSP